MQVFTEQINCKLLAACGQGAVYFPSKIKWYDHDRLNFSHSLLLHSQLQSIIAPWSVTN